MNLPRKVVTLLVLSILSGGLAGGYAFLELGGVWKREDKLVARGQVLIKIADLRRDLWTLSGLPARAMANPSNAGVYYEDLKYITGETNRHLKEIAAETGVDIRPDWDSYLAQLKELMPRAVLREPGIGEALLRYESDDHLQMNMVLRNLMDGERAKMEAAQAYLTRTRRQIALFLAGGLILGLLLAAEAYRETAAMRAQNLLVKKIAGTDPLTGLSNRRSFDDAFAKAWTEEGPLSVILFDIDHFKTYNDNYGHPEGDRLLRILAHSARSKCPPNGLIARWGGEEFVLLLPGRPLEEASGIAEGLRKTVATLHEASPEPLARPVTISLGVAASVRRRGGPQDLLHSADKALYKAKHEGRNRWVTEHHD
jgi:diguanylate cyclase (GGDEF)-like protein